MIWMDGYRVWNRVLESVVKRRCSDNSLIVRLLQCTNEFDVSRCVKSPVYTAPITGFPSIRHGIELGSSKMPAI